MHMHCSKQTTTTYVECYVGTSLTTCGMLFLHEPMHCSQSHFRWLNGNDLNGLLFPYIFFFYLQHSAPSWILSLTKNLESFSLQHGARIATIIIILILVQNYLWGRQAHISFLNIMNITYYTLHITY